MPPAPFSAEEQDLLTWLLSSIPRWFWLDDPRFSSQELWASVVKSLVGVQRQGEDWVRDTFILTATDVWLNAHARDRDTGRQESESDSALRERLRTIPDVVTRPALLRTINQILVGSGITDEAAMLELPKDGAWLGTYLAMSGFGGTFTQVGTTTGFVPTTLPWPAPPFQGVDVVPPINYKLVISGAASAANDGTRVITGLDGDAALVTNGLGVAEIDPIVTWRVDHYDQDDNLLDGFGRSYCGRGWRCARRRPFRMIIILPFGTTAGIQASVEEAVRQQKAGGFAAIVERRLNP